MRTDMSHDGTCQEQAASYRLLATGYWLQDSGSRTTAAEMVQKADREWLSEWRTGLGGN